MAIVAGVRLPYLVSAILAAWLAAPTSAAASPTAEILLVFGGAVADPAHTEYVEDASDRAIPQLPIVYDDEDHD
jgi:hypothetical protein